MVGSVCAVVAGVAGMKNARDGGCRCLRAFFFNQGRAWGDYGKAGRFGRVFYGSLQTIHLIHFRGGGWLAGTDGVDVGMAVRCVVDGIWLCRPMRFCHVVRPGSRRVWGSVFKRRDG